MRVFDYDVITKAGLVARVTHIARVRYEGDWVFFHMENLHQLGKSTTDPDYAFHAPQSGELMGDSDPEG